MRTLLGVILAVTPAALWIAWTPGMLYAVMAIAIVAAGLLVLLTESAPQPREGEKGRVTLPDAFIDEVHSVFPLTYHHSAAGPSRFRRAMHRAQESLKSQ